MFRKVFFLSIVFILSLFACAKAARLVWNPNTETDLAGYKVYRGQSSGFYDHTIDIGNVTEHQIEALDPGTYYYAVTAYNTSGAESGFSNEVIYVRALEGIASATDLQIIYGEQQMTVRSDNFNRSNETPLAGNWSPAIDNSPYHAIDLVSNQVQGNGSVTDNTIYYWNADVFSGDQSTQVKVTNVGVEFGPCLKVGTGAARQFYFAAFYIGLVWLYRYSSGAYFEITEAVTCAVSNGDIVKMTIVGTIIKVYVNDVEVISGSDSVLTTGSPGFYVCDAGVSKLDDWEGGDLAAGLILEQKAFRGINRGIMRGAM